MSDRESLKEVVSQLYQTPVSEIGPSFSLRHRRFNGSAGRGLLAAAIRRRLGRYAAQSFSATTYGELEAAVCGLPAESGAAHANAAPNITVVRQPDLTGAAPPGLSVGVDLEMVDSLPQADDFWTSDFYRTHFTRGEIAYCVQQDEPRMHFAARWCAKEALGKCDSRFLTIDPSTIQVSLEESGRPIFEWLRDATTERLPHAVSLTHTPLLAAAIVALADAERGWRANAAAFTDERVARTGR